MPPEFDKLPTPGERRAAKRETSILEETFGQQDDEIYSEPSSIEESILKKIKRN